MLPATIVRAETLAEALSRAYRDNPVLQQARAQQRALDETDVQARAGWRPTVSVMANENYERVYGSQPPPGTTSGGATLDVEQPLYTGGRVAAAVDAADATIMAGRDTLRLSESTILGEVIQSYADVLRDQSLLEISEEDLKTLNRVADEIGAKRSVGQISRTDLVQIQAQVALAEATLETARAQLATSRAEYEAVVGTVPGELVKPDGLPGLPADADAAYRIADGANPALHQALQQEQAAIARLSAARSESMPSVAARMQYGYVGNTEPLSTIDYGRAFTAQVVVTVPLFAGGLHASSVRENAQLSVASREGVEAARRQVVRDVSLAWNQLVAVRRARVSQEKAMDAARAQLVGTQEEYHLALRSTLEVLSADQTVRQIQSAIASADHDELVAEADLLAAIGRLQLAWLLPDQPTYDADSNLRHVRKIGAMPYESLIAGLDRLAAPGPGRIPPPPQTPGSSIAPVLPPGTPPPLDAPLADRRPSP